MSSSANIMTCRRFEIVVLVILMTFLCSGCVENRQSPEVQLIDAFVIRINDKSSAKLVSEIKKSTARSNPNMQYMDVRGETDGLRFNLNVRGSLSITYDGEQKEIVFLKHGVFYQLNSGIKEMFDISERHSAAVPNSSNAYSGIKYIPPAPLGDYKMGFLQTTLTPDSLESIKTQKKNVHRLYFPFTVDGEPYAVDVTFKVKLHSWYEVAVPGVP